MSCTRLQRITRHSRTKMPLLLVLGRAPLASRSSKVTRSLVRRCSCRRHDFLLQPCHSRIHQGVFQRFGSRSSALTVVPFNQGSKQDVEALVDYIYTTLGLDLDYVIPFAAVPENGHKIDSLDDKRTP